MLYHERDIINMIVHDIPLNQDETKYYVNFIVKIDTLSGRTFDRHCRLINSLSKDEFNKYMNFLSINIKNKGV